MYCDARNLRHFYRSSLGQILAQQIHQEIDDCWPDLQCQEEPLLGIGYCAPYFHGALQEGQKISFGTPAWQGVIRHAGPRGNCTFLLEEDHLPIAGQMFSRIFIIHTFEHCRQPELFLDEIWRILQSGGRALMIVPNRAGFWTHSDKTPFTGANAYFDFRLSRLFLNHKFEIRQKRVSMHLPPLFSQLSEKKRKLLAKMMGRIFPVIGGLLIFEIEKCLHHPISTSRLNTDRFSERWRVDPAR